MTVLTVGDRQRIVSVDILRGLVMVIMAIDHVRDFYSITPYQPEDLSQASAGLFLTRWITHFCAPVFVFLAGTSAWLYRGNKGASKAELARFLLTRGLWLILIELTVVNVSWQFGYQFVFVQVIWAIGCSMVVLAGLVFLPWSVILTAGLVLIAGHNLLDGVPADAFGRWAWLWNVLHVQTYVPNLFGSPLGVFVAYPLIPWIGVIAVGYCFGALLEHPPAIRDRRLLAIGLAATAAFLILRGFDLYGESGIGPADAPWTAHDGGALTAALSFLNTTKYPPSLQFLLMTLGPAIALMPLLERWRGRAAAFFTVFGRVPFLFYVLHLPLIHLTSRLWAKATYDVWGVTPFDQGSWPADFEPSLIRIYLATALIVGLLYWPCKWFVEYRKTHRQWWLSYL